VRALIKASSSLWAVSVFDYSCQQHNACLGVRYFRTLDSQASVVVKRIIIASRCVAAPTHIPTCILEIDLSRALPVDLFILFGSSHSRYLAVISSLSLCYSLLDSARICGCIFVFEPLA